MVGDKLISNGTVLYNKYSNHYKNRMTDMTLGKNTRVTAKILLLVLLVTAGCATSGGDTYKDANMDFGAIKAVAVLPFQNLSRDSTAAERVRDVFSTMLMSTGGIYVIPTGEVARGIARVGMTAPATPSSEEIKKFASLVSANAVITGVVREYGEVRSGNTAANVISMSLQMIEPDTGRVIWSASTTRGGIGFGDRLLGGGGQPMNDITAKACNDLIDKLFK